jgi:DNA invertase Pin-like site-specific DNA recombinase
MRTALYARVSSEEQIDNWSISAQKHEYEQHCKQKDWLTSRVYIEEGKSARSDSIEKRPQFKRLLEDCKKREFDVVVVHSLDRWSRNLRVTLESFKQLADCGIAFVSITENIDYSTPEGRLFIAMIGAFAQYFSDSLAKHTSKGMKERAMNGFQNGDVPFGYERCNEDCPSEHRGKIHTVPTEVEAVSKLFQFYAGGNWSLSKLAAWLNEQGFRTRNKRELLEPDGNSVNGPRPFTLYSVRWLLHNPFFVGKVKYHDQLFNGKHEAIVDERVFNLVQEKLKDAKNRTRSVSPSYRLYLLKGIARCVYCGYPIWSETSSSKYGYYREQKGTRVHSDCPANGKAIRCNMIDEQIDKVIQSLVLEPSWRERIIAKISTLSERELMLKQRKQIQEKLRRLGKTYLDGVIEDGEYNLQRKLLQDNLDSLVIPEADAAMNAGELLESLGLIWQKTTIEEKHKLLTGMLEAVYIDLAASRSIVGIQPKPAFYPLFEALKQKPEAKVTLFHPGSGLKTTDSTITMESENFGLVETGES